MSGGSRYPKNVKNSSALKFRQLGSDKEIMRIFGAFFILGSIIFCGKAFAEESEPGSFESKSLAGVDDSLTRIEKLLEYRTVKIKTKTWTWEELDRFQGMMWHAMALDPAMVDSKEIPPHLDPVNLTRDMRKGLTDLIQSRHVAEKYGVEKSFDDYVALCETILKMREDGLYRKARLLGKKGTIEELYTGLANSLGTKAQSQVELSVVWDKADRKDLIQELGHVRGELNSLNQHFSEIRQPTSIPDDKLASLKQLLWVMFPLVFFTGLVGGLTWRSQSSGRVEEHDPHHHG